MLPHRIEFMRIIRQPAELGTRKVCLAIGVLDGVHLGHQQVLRQTLSDARQHNALAVALTFDRHPNAVVAPAHNPPLIYSLPQKLRAIEALGLDATLLIHFDRAFSEKSAEDFIHELAAGFGQIHSICVGAGFTFGYKRSGNVTLLQILGKDLKFSVHGLAAVSLDGKIVSSTRIREAVREGNLDAASQMLGRAYALAGPVIRGDQLGRKLGVPTANVDVGGLVLPPFGVYAGHAAVQGQLFSAAVNIGLRPTLQGAAPRTQVEAHLLDFAGDIYGEEMELTLVEKLRDEQKFDSLEALRQQILRDIVHARETLE
jgi:riboflavin kinase/FMN adenylyltransferase